jgi:GTP-binding protein
MKTVSIKKASFIKSAILPKDYPRVKDSRGSTLPEIAVAGRSNVGKSTLLNHLFQSQNLVKTSSTPGKTQMLNFFSVDDALIFVDLPGYGYAQVPMQVRKQWGPMVESYLMHRPELKVVLCLFDIRRVPNDEDRLMMEWAVKAEKSVILVLTKVDKVSANEKKNNTLKILQAFPYENLHYVHYSATKNVGRKELIAMLFEALEEEKNGPDE